MRACDQLAGPTNGYFRGLMFLGKSGIIIFLRNWRLSSDNGRDSNQRLESGCMRKHAPPPAVLSRRCLGFIQDDYMNPVDNACASQ